MSKPATMTVDIVEGVDGSAETVIRLGFGRVVEDQAEVVASLVALVDTLLQDWGHPALDAPTRAERRAARRRRHR